LPKHRKYRTAAIPSIFSGDFKKRGKSDLRTYAELSKLKVNESLQAEGCKYNEESD
tara:strand:+ start:189 stop:356 length:168 start_codon:yes stop_codon:yes gene_type:complete